MNPHEQHAVVESVSEEHIVLSVGGITLQWPRTQAPRVKPGDTVIIRLLTEQQATTDRHEQARVVLKELLGGER